MFRNQYDGDVSVWSPQGRIHQVEYAMEAVKQGSATVGIRSKTHCVLVARKRAANDLCSHQKKIISIDDHVAVSIAGLLSDGWILSRYLQNQCAEYKWDHKENMPLAIMEDRLTLRQQRNTQGYGGRPFGVGMLISGVDVNGAHLYRSDPSGEITECLAMAIGGRSQSARTFLEKNLSSFADATLDELVRFALLALRDTIPPEEELTFKNTSISMVGVESNVKVLENDQVAPYLLTIADVPRARQPGAAREHDQGPPKEPEAPPAPVEPMPDVAVEERPQAPDAP